MHSPNLFPSSIAPCEACVFFSSSLNHSGPAAALRCSNATFVVPLFVCLQVYDKQSVIDIAVPDLAVVEECFFVQYKAGGVLGKKKKMFQFWFHTSFVEGDSLVSRLFFSILSCALFYLLLSSLHLLVYD